MNCQTFFDSLSGFSTIHAIKLYRLQPEMALPVPTLPCLDHEAMLHEGIAPHAAAYIEDRGGHLHEVVFIPDERRLYIDIASTMGECTPESHDALMAALHTAFPGFKVSATRLSWLKGDRRVASACRAQVTLRDVLTGDNIDRTKTGIDRLQTISSLMEKQSRVGSWSARTAVTPLLAVAGFLTYELAGVFIPRLGSASVTLIRTTTVGALGGILFYYGMKAVHLTEMANRVWKRSAEYNLILSERRRLKR